jgi:Insertion element 4 transposase N-terminal/Transposase DDE domain
VAGGVFAPGHLGELTQYLPFELVDDVLEQTRAVQRRLRLLPSRAGVYFVLALGMFPCLGYARVWAKLTAGLGGMDLPGPSEKALRDLRRRLGPVPLRALFEVVAGPLAQPHTPGVRFAGLRTVAFDGLNSVKVPDTSRNRAWLGKIRHRLGLAGYPALRVMALAETGTRGLLGATIGSVSARDETHLARRLLHLLGPGMLVLLDRGFDDGAFFAEITAAGAAVLARAKSARRPLVLGHLPDGSYLSRLDSRNCRHSLDVRIIEAGVVMTGADGSRVAESYRLITTLTDHCRYPADALVRLYHERWEIESAFLALRHTLLNGRVLRSGDRPGAEQELWALLTLYQLLRTAMVTAVETRPGTNPDRASFTTALEAARDQLTMAQGVCPEDPADLPGVIGRAVLSTLLQARRPRYSARKVKCATSRYIARDDGRPRTPATITAISITICTLPPGPPAASTRRHRKNPARTGPQPPTRRQRVTALMATEPRDWSGRELAERLQIPPRNLHTQLGEWAKLGFITRTGFAVYALNTPPDPESSTAAPDP